MEIYFDGSCTPVNPSGTARWGVVIKKDGRIIKTLSGTVGTGEGMTNNVAEWSGFHAAVKYLKDNPVSAIIFGDSLLVIKQASGKHRINADMPYTKYAVEAMKDFKSLEEKPKLIWIRRELNIEADALSNGELLPEETSGKTFADYDESFDLNLKSDLRPSWPTFPFPFKATKESITNIQKFYEVDFETAKKAAIDCEKLDKELREEGIKTNNFDW